MSRALQIQRLLLVAVGVMSCVGCGSSREEIKFASNAARPLDQTIDRDPWQLLPGGAVGLLRVDKRIWDADFGDDLAEFIQGHLPYPSDVGFDPRTDIDVIVGAAYATVQNDVAFVCQGRFAAEQLAPEERATLSTHSGQPIQRITFAGESMYVTPPFAMATLTRRTMVFGTQLGVRRVLEVVEEGRMGRRLPAWYEALLRESGAHLQLGMDLDADTVPAVLRTRLEFLNHLRAARLVGNYKGGGLNLAGALTFDTPQAAAHASQEINTAEEQVEQFRLLLQAMGMPALFRRIAAQSTGKDAQFAVELEAEAISYFLKRGDEVSAHLLEQAE